MPLYTYVCECGNEEEHLVLMDSRDSIELDCSRCGKRLKRIVDGAPALHGEKYQMKAVMSDGSHVAGHFGKEAPRVRKK